MHIVCESTLNSVKLTAFKLNLSGVCVGHMLLCKPLCFVLFCGDTLLPSHNQYRLFSISYGYYC